MARSSKTKGVLIAAFSFLAGSFVGALVAKTKPVDTMSAKQTAQGASVSAKVNDLSSSARIPSVENEAFPDKPKLKSSNDVIPLWKYLAAAGKRNGAEASWLKLPSLTAPYSMSAEHPVTDEFAAFFDLTPDERTRLDASISDLYAQQRAYESQHYTAVTPGDPKSNFGIKIPAYPEKGAELFDKLNQELRSVLGDKKHSLLSNWGDEDLEKNLTGMGLYEREIWVQKPDQNDASWKAIYFERGPGGYNRQFSIASQSLTELERAIRVPISALPEAKTPATQK